MPELRKANAHLQLIREINDSGDQFPSEPIHGHGKKAIDEWDNTDCDGVSLVSCFRQLSDWRGVGT